MLLFRSHYRNALKRNPFGEARLVGVNIGDMNEEEAFAFLQTVLQESERVKANEIAIATQIREYIEVYRGKIVQMITSGSEVEIAELENKTPLQFVEEFLTNVKGESPELEIAFRKRILRPVLDKNKKEILEVDKDGQISPSVRIEDSLLHSVVESRRNIVTTLEQKNQSIHEEVIAFANTSTIKDVDGIFDAFKESNDDKPGLVSLIEKKKDQLKNEIYKVIVEKLKKRCAIYTETSSRSNTSKEMPRLFAEEPEITNEEKIYILNNKDVLIESMDIARIKKLKMEFKSYKPTSHILSPEQKIRSFLSGKTDAEKELIEHVGDSFFEATDEVGVNETVVTRLSPDKIYQNAKSLSDKYKSMRESMGKIITMTSKYPQTPRVQQAKDQLREFEEQLQSQKSIIDNNLAMADMLHQWNTGAVAPMTFLLWLEAQTGDASRKAAINRAKEFVINTANNSSNKRDTYADLSTNEAWNGPNYANISDKYTAISYIESIVNTQAELQDADVFMKSFNSSLVDTKKKRDIPATIDAMLESVQKESSNLESQGRGARFVVEWYSIMDIVNGTQEWWDSYKSAWAKSANLRKGKFQNKVAHAFKWLPYGAEGAKESEKKLDGAHREERGKWKEGLEEAKPKFADIFGNEGLLSEAILKRDIDYVMAIVEYAATHGWLYELRDTEAVNGYKVVEYLPNHWDENRKAIYLDNLIGDNESGFDKEISGTASSIAKKYDSKYDYIEKELDAYLEQINIPAALGAMQAMYDRAIDGDEGAHIAVHFFNALRKNALLRKYMTTTMLQKIGRVSTGRAAFTMTNVWPDRKNLSAISKMPEKEMTLESMQKMGNLASAIATAETIVRTTSGEAFEGKNGETKLNEYVANILSGNIVYFPKTQQSASLWSEEFANYRDGTNGVHGFVGTELASKTDMDYFVSGKAELMLASDNFYSGVFKMESQGTWVLHEKARALVKDIKIRYEALLEAYPITGPRSKNHPAEIFKKEIGYKIQKAIATNLNRTDRILEYTIPPDQNERGKEETNIIAWLAGNGFIELDEFKDPKGEPAYRELPPAIQAQIDKIRGVAPSNRQQPPPTSRAGAATPTTAI